MLRYGLSLRIIISSLIINITTFLVVQAQDTLQIQDSPQRESPDSIYQKILELEKSVNELNTILVEQKQEDELEALLKEADRLSMQEKEQKIDLSKKYFSGVRQQQGLNPNISFGMDFFGGVSTSNASSIGYTPVIILVLKSGYHKFALPKIQG